MNVTELFDSLQEKVEQVEKWLHTAKDEAESAESNANEAEDFAQIARCQADEAQGSLREANSFLDQLREQLSELREQVEEQEEGNDSVGASGLQKDMHKWKVKVLALHERGATKAQIASKLEIGEFLVSRILETFGKQAA